MDDNTSDVVHLNYESEHDKVKQMGPGAGPNMFTALVVSRALSMPGLLAFILPLCLPPSQVSRCPSHPCFLWPVATCYLRKHVSAASITCAVSFALDVLMVPKPMIVPCIVPVPRESVLEGEGVRQRFTNCCLTSVPMSHMRALEQSAHKPRVVLPSQEHTVRTRCTNVCPTMAHMRTDNPCLHGYYMPRSYVHHMQVPRGAMHHPTNMWHI